MAGTAPDRVCISCGMPLKGPQDFWQGDTSKDYCVHCSRDDGNMRSYDEAVVGMGFFIQQRQGLETEAAARAAKEWLAKMPAWQGHE